MSKKVKILLVAILIAILILISSFAYATITEYVATETQAEATSAAVVSEVNSVLTALGETNLVSTTAKSKIDLSTKSDPYRNINYYTVSTQNYRINVDSASNKAVNILNLTADLNPSTTATKEQANTYITEIYKALELPEEYELVYLEPFPGKLWEADFQKNYDGVYNKYEAVKVIFNAVSKDIIALTVFDENYSDVAKANMAECNTNDSIKALSINEDNIKDISVTFIKPSSLIDSDSNDSSIHKAKVIKQSIPQKNDIDLVTLTYIDYYTGEFLGGAILQ